MIKPFKFYLFLYLPRAACRANDRICSTSASAEMARKWLKSFLDRFFALLQDRTLSLFLHFFNEIQ